MAITRERPRAQWLVPPRLLTTDETDDRRASWLELFFDLVFVVAITELSGQLVVDHSAAGFLRFAALFVPVYVAWQGYMAYATRFDTDDLAFRLAYFAGMLAIAAMATQIGDVAHGVHSAGFAVSYVCLRSIVVALYWRAWRAVPEARQLILLYGGGYGLAALAWLGSLALDTPLRYWVWGIALAFELSLPPASMRLHRRIPTSPRHLPERWALFTLIVLGESVVAVATTTADTSWRLPSVTAAALGFATVAALWWLYFDRQASVELHGSTTSIIVYSYAHLPLLVGLAATGAGVRLLIERASADELGAGASAALLGGVALFLVSLVATRSVTVSGSHRLGILLKLSAAAIVVVLVLAQAAFPPLVLAGGLALVLVSIVLAERTLFPASSSGD